MLSISRGLYTEGALTECATHDSYAAHKLCKHPDQVLPKDDLWTNHVLFEPCEAGELAARHARDSREQVYCSEPECEALIDDNLPSFCASCDDVAKKPMERASFMWTDFETKRDQWEYKGGLSPEEVQMIEDHMVQLRQEILSVSRQGPYNQSYWTLKRLLGEYIKHWDSCVNNKLEDERQQKAQEQEAKMYQAARFSSGIEDAMETMIYAPGELRRLQESGSQSHSDGQSGSSSHSHHHRHRHGSSHGSSSHGSSSKSSSKLSRWFSGRR